MSKIRAFELDDGTRVPLMIECPTCKGDKRVGPYDSAPHIETGWKQCTTCDGSGEVRNPALESIEGGTECSHGWRQPHCTKDNEGSCPSENDRDNPKTDCRCRESQWVTAWVLRGLKP